MTPGDFLMRILALAFLYFAAVSGACAWRQEVAWLAAGAGALAFAMLGAAVCFWRGGKPDPIDQRMLKAAARADQEGEWR